MTQLLPNIFAIEVPELIVDIELTHSKDKVVFWTAEEGHYDIDLPPGSYEIMFATKEAEEAQAASIVDKGEIYKVWYRNYEHKGFKEIAHFKTALASLHSLLKSKGLTAGNYLVIKKVN